MRPKKYKTAAERQEAYRNRKAGNVTIGVTKPGNVTESVTDEHGVTEPVTDVYDKAKYPVREAWEIAVIRAQRARKYAAALPEHVRPVEKVFQTVDWQYENEGLPAVKRSVAA